MLEMSLKARNALLRACPKCAEQYARFAETGKGRRFCQKRHTTARQPCAGVSKMDYVIVPSVPDGKDRNTSRRAGTLHRKTVLHKDSLNTRSCLRKTKNIMFNGTLNTRSCLRKTKNIMFNGTLNTRSPVSGMVESDGSDQSDPSDWRCLPRIRKKETLSKMWRLRTRGIRRLFRSSGIAHFDLCSSAF